MSSVMEPLCEKCGRDAASTQFIGLDGGRVRCGNCGHEFKPWAPEDEADYLRHYGVAHEGDLVCDRCPGMQGAGAGGNLRELVDQAALHEASVHDPAPNARLELLQRAEA